MFELLIPHPLHIRTPNVLSHHQCIILPHHINSIRNNIVYLCLFVIVVVGVSASLHQVYVERVLLFAPINIGGGVGIVAPYIPNMYTCIHVCVLMWRVEACGAGKKIRMGGGVYNA